jgi:hypothetical protein
VLSFARKKERLCSKREEASKAEVSRGLVMLHGIYIGAFVSKKK